MPRRRPGALRAEQWRPSSGVPARRVTGVSALTRVAIRRVEAECLSPDAVAVALARFESFLRRSDRYLWLPGIEMDCPCCSPLEARDDLETVLSRLPPKARADLMRRLSWADEQFERRTLPDPVARQIAVWQPGEAWWRQRLAGL